MDLDRFSGVHWLAYALGEKMSKERYFGSWPYSEKKFVLYRYQRTSGREHPAAILSRTAANHRPQNDIFRINTACRTTDSTPLVVQSEQ